MRWVSYTEPQGATSACWTETPSRDRWVPNVLSLLGDDVRTCAMQPKRPPTTNRGRRAHRCPTARTDLAPPSIRDSLCFLDHLRGCGEQWGYRRSCHRYGTPCLRSTSAIPRCGRPFDDVAISPGSSLFDFELEVAR